MNMQLFPCTIVAALCLGAFTARAQNYYTQPTYAPPPIYAPRPVYAPPVYIAPPTYAPRPAYPPPQVNYYYFPEGAGPYIRAGVGPSFFENGRLTKFGGRANSSVHYDTGLAADMALGYAFNPFISLDFETGYIGARINNVPGHTSDHSSIANVPLLANVTVSMPIPHSNVVPYAGLGVGGAVSVFNTDGLSDGVTTVTGSESDTVGAWQAFAGVRFMLSPRMSLGVGYKYFATDNSTFSYPPSPKFDVGFRGVRTHSVLLTLQADFW